MKSLVLLILCSAALAKRVPTRDATLPKPCPHASSPPSKQVVCYYGGRIPVRQIDPCLCTMLVYSSAADISSNYTLQVDTGVRSATRELKTRNPALQVILGVGGERVPAEVSETLVRSSERRRRLAISVGRALRLTGLDGVELDLQWALEGSDSKAKAGLVALVKMLRAELDLPQNLLDREKRDYDVSERIVDDVTTSEWTPTRPDGSSARILRRPSTSTTTSTEGSTNSANDTAENYLALERPTNKRRLLLRVPVLPELIVKRFELKNISKYVDYLTVPTHNLSDATERGVTYHPSRLMGLSDILNTDSMLDLLTGLGAPHNMIIISLPAAGTRFTLADASQTTPRSAVVDGPHLVTQTQLCKLLTQGGWTLERDDDLTAPYAFKNSTWMAFDDQTSVGIKSKYVMLRDLAGAALYQVDDEDWTGTCARLHNSSRAAPWLLKALYSSFTSLSRKSRGALLATLEEDIKESTLLTFSGEVQLSPYRIVRVIDNSGAVHVVRKNAKTEFECSRQGYFVHPLGCNRFYRCVKFNQYSRDFTVFEYDCPAGLAFDERWEVCVWPGSLPRGSPCTGSSEIAPVPRARYACPAVEGYYADPENCRWFFACLDHARDGASPLTAYEFRCPFGLVFDGQKLACDWPWLVDGCGSGGYGGAFFGAALFGSAAHARYEAGYSASSAVSSSVSGAAHTFHGSSASLGLAQKANAAYSSTLHSGIGLAGGVGLAGVRSGAFVAGAGQGASAVLVDSGAAGLHAGGAHLVNSGAYVAGAGQGASAVLVDSGAAGLRGSGAHLVNSGAYVAGAGQGASAVLVDSGAAGLRGSGAHLVNSGAYVAGARQGASAVLVDSGAAGLHGSGAHLVNSGAYVAGADQGASAVLVDSGAAGLRGSGAHLVNSGAYVAGARQGASAVLVDSGAAGLHGSGANLVNSGAYVAGAGQGASAVLVDSGAAGLRESSFHGNGATGGAFAAGGSAYVARGGVRSGYEAGSYNAGRQYSSYASLPDSYVSGGRIENTGGVILGENVAISADDGGRFGILEGVRVGQAYSGRGRANAALSGSSFVASSGLGGAGLVATGAAVPVAQAVPVVQPVAQAVPVVNTYVQRPRVSTVVQPVAQAVTFVQPVSQAVPVVNTYVQRPRVSAVVQPIAQAVPFVQPVAQAVPVVRPVSSVSYQRRPVLRTRLQPIVSPTIQPAVQPVNFVQSNIQPVVHTVPIVSPSAQPILQPVVQQVPLVRPTIQPVVQTVPIVNPIQPVVQNVPVATYGLRSRARVVSPVTTYTNPLIASVPQVSVAQPIVQSVPVVTYRQRPRVQAIAPVVTPAVKHIQTVFQPTVHPYVQSVPVVQPTVRPYIQSVPVVQPTVRPYVQPVSVVQPSIRPYIQSVPVVQPTVRPYVQPVSVVQPSVRPYIQSVPVVQPTVRPYVQPVSVVQPSVRPYIQSVPVVQPTVRPYVQPVSVVQPSVRPYIQSVQSVPVVQPVRLAQPSVQPYVQSVPIVQPTVQPFVAAPQPAVPVVTYQRRPSTRTQVPALAVSTAAPAVVYDAGVSSGYTYRRPSGRANIAVTASPVPIAVTPAPVAFNRAFFGGVSQSATYSVPSAGPTVVLPQPSSTVIPITVSTSAPRRFFTSRPLSGYVTGQDNVAFVSSTVAPQAYVPVNTAVPRVTISGTGYQSLGGRRKGLGLVSTISPIGVDSLAVYGQRPAFGIPAAEIVAQYPNVYEGATGFGNLDAVYNSTGFGLRTVSGGGYQVNQAFAAPISGLAYSAGVARGRTSVPVYSTTVRPSVAVSYAAPSYSTTPVPTFSDVLSTRRPATYSPNYVIAAPKIAVTSTVRPLVTNSYLPPVSPVVRIQSTTPASIAIGGYASQGLAQGRRVSGGRGRGRVEASSGDENVETLLNKYSGNFGGVLNNNKEGFISGVISGDSLGRLGGSTFAPTTFGSVGIESTTAGYSADGYSSEQGSTQRSRARTQRPKGGVVYAGGNEAVDVLLDKYSGNFGGLLNNNKEGFISSVVAGDAAARLGGRISSSTTVRPPVQLTTEAYLEDSSAGRGRGQNAKTSGEGQFRGSSYGEDENVQTLLDQYSGKFGGVLSANKEDYISSVISEVSARGRGSAQGARGRVSVESGTNSGASRNSVTTTAPLGSFGLDGLTSGYGRSKSDAPVIVVTRLSDVNPLLIAKLGAQCTCKSNTVSLNRNRGSSRGRDRGDYDDESSGSYPSGRYEADSVSPGNLALSYAAVPSLSTIPSSTLRPLIVSTTPFSTARGRVALVKSPVGVSPVTLGPIVSTVPVSGALDSSALFGQRSRRPQLPVLLDSGVAAGPALGVSVPVTRVLSPARVAVVSTAAPVVVSALPVGAESRGASGEGEAVKFAGRSFDRYGPGGWRGVDETLQGSVDCQRPGLFRHPKYCNKFYACHWDEWKGRYTLHVFNCPVQLAYDSSLGACNWPSQGPACADDNLLV